MITVSALYPSSEGGSFDRAYYLEKHIPMVVSKLGKACMGATVEFGDIPNFTDIEPAIQISEVAFRQQVLP